MSNKKALSGWIWILIILILIVIGLIIYFLLVGGGGTEGGILGGKIPQPPALPG